MKKFIHISQFSISLIAPVALCVLLSVGIQRHYGTGYWVNAVGILIGIAAMMNTYYRFYRKTVADADKDRISPPGYNRHR